MAALLPMLAGTFNDAAPGAVNADSARNAVVMFAVLAGLLVAFFVVVLLTWRSRRLRGRAGADAGTAATLDPWREAGRRALPYDAPSSEDAS